MKKFISVAAVFFIAAFIALPTQAQQAPPPPGQAAAGAAPMQQAPAEMSPERQQEMADREAEEQLRFNNRKTEMVKEIGDRITEMQGRIAEMQKQQTCFQGAANQQAMQACYPNFGGGGQRHWNGGNNHGGNPGFGNTPQPNGTPNGGH